MQQINFQIKVKHLLAQGTKHHGYGCDTKFLQTKNRWYSSYLYGLDFIEKVKRQLQLDLPISVFNRGIQTDQCNNQEQLCVRKEHAHLFGPIFRKTDRAEAIFHGFPPYTMLCRVYRKSSGEVTEVSFYITPDYAKMIEMLNGEIKIEEQEGVYIINFPDQKHQDFSEEIDNFVENMEIIYQNV